MKMAIHKSQRIGILPSVVIGCTVSLIVCLLAAVCCPITILNGMIDEGIIGIMAGCVQTIGIFLGAVVGGLVVNEKKLITTFLCTGLFVVISISFAVMFFEFDIDAVIWRLLGSIIGTICASFIIFRKDRRGKNNRSKHRYR